jgi:hypothetical protein
MKDEQRLGKVHEVVLKTQATPTSKMSVVMCAKVETLQKHTTLQLFTMHVDMLVFDLKMKENLQLQRLEEMVKLKWQSVVLQNLAPIYVVMVTKIHTEITTNIATTIAMPISKYVQKDLTSVVLSPNIIKKLDNVDCLIFNIYNNQ